MKGLDAAVWTVCKTLGLQIVALPVYDAEDGGTYDDYPSEDSEDDENNAPEQTRWDPFSLFCFEGASRSHLSDSGPEWIGYELEPMHEEDLGEYEQPIGRRMFDGPFNRCRGIHWLNSPRFTERNAAYIAV